MTDQDLQVESDVKEAMVEEDLVKKLREMTGTTGAVIVAQDGIVLADDIEGNADKEGSLAAFLGPAAGQIGEALALGDFDAGVIHMRNVRMLVLEQPDYYVGLLLEKRASPIQVASQVKGMLR